MPLNIKDIKLRKERIDEWTVYHHYDAGTKHLPAIYAEKHHYYDIHNAETGERLTWGDDYLRTLKDVKNWIANYDDIEDARIAKKEKDLAEHNARHEAYRAYANGLVENHIAPIDAAPTIKAGDYIEWAEGKHGKPSKLAEALVELYEPSKAKVVKVVEVSNEEYDAAAKNLYENVPAEWFDNELGSGHASDSELLEGKDYNEVYNNPSLKAVWFETNYALVHAVVAPNRRPLYLNGSGHAYARYVGVGVNDAVYSIVKYPEAEGGH